MSANKVFRFSILCFALYFLCGCNVVFSNRRDAYQHMSNIKKNFVLIELKSEEISQEKLYEEDLEKVKALETYFDFSDYFFFKAEDSKLIANGDFKELIIFDKNLKQKEGSFLLDRDYYIMSFEGVFGNQEIHTDENGKRRAIGGSQWYPGIAMLDKDYIELVKPFPQLGVLPSAHSHGNHTKRIRAYSRDLNYWYKVHKSRIGKLAE